MLVNSQGPAPAMGVAFPDLLLEPPFGEPVPLENTSLGPTAIPTCYNVFLMGMPAHNLATMRPVSIDGPGVGALCGADFGPARDMIGCTNLFLGGPPATKVAMPTNQNLVNAFGLNVSPSQFVLDCLA